MLTIIIHFWTSLEDLGRALIEVKIDYCNLDRDIVYLRRLFEKYFLSFQNNTDLPGGWYNSYIVAPIFERRWMNAMCAIQRFQDLHKRYQTLLMKEADYYLDDENTWTSH
ncbi:unnamed protein product [Rhizophagus irregularis]|nr:unnamed protein product [Rhizophagus irregularis]